MSCPQLNKAMASVINVTTCRRARLASIEWMARVLILMSAREIMDVSMDVSTRPIPTGKWKKR